MLPTWIITCTPAAAYLMPLLCLLWLIDQVWDTQAMILISISATRLPQVKACCNMCLKNGDDSTPREATGFYDACSVCNCIQLTRLFMTT